MSNSSDWYNTGYADAEKTYKERIEELEILVKEITRSPFYNIDATMELKKHVQDVMHKN